MWVAELSYSESWCKQHSWREGIPTPFFITDSKMLVYIKVKLVTIVEGNQKAPFLIATTPRVLLLSLDCSTLLLIHALYCWVLSKEVSSTIFKVFGMTWPGIGKMLRYCWIWDHFKLQYYQTDIQFFQFVSLFGQTGAEKLQNSSFQIIWLDR